MKRFTICLLLFSVTFVTGCQSEINQKLSAFAQQNIQKAALLYTIYTALNNYTTPSNIEELKSFFEGNEKAQKGLSNVGMSVSKINDYLISPRDNQPYKFRWNAKVSPLSPPYPVAFETLGVDGVRLVSFAGGKIVEVTDDGEYEKLMAGKHEVEDTERD